MTKRKNALIALIICVPVLALLVSFIVILVKVSNKNNEQGAFISAKSGSEYVSIFLGLELEDEDQIEYYHNFYNDMTAEDDYAVNLETGDSGYSVTLTSGKEEQTFKVVYDESVRYESDGGPSEPNYFICVEAKGEDRYYNVSTKKVQKLIKQIKKDLDDNDAWDDITESDAIDWNVDRLEATTYNGYPKNQIVLIRDYTNYAWGVCQEGYFIDLSGNYYTYDLGNRRIWQEAQEAYPDAEDQNEAYNDYIMEVLYNEFYLTTDPVGHVGIDAIQTFYCEGLFLPADIEYDEECVACDAGQLAYYYYNGRNRIVLESTGDWEIFAKNSIAKDMVKLAKMIVMIEY